MGITRAAAAAMLLTLAEVGGAAQETLKSPTEVSREAEIEAARATEKELNTALEKLRDGLAELEQTRQAPAVTAIEELKPVRIVNGIATIAFPSVGALLKGGELVTARSLCTGTLIGCQHFLTANHCLRDGRNPAIYQVYLQNFGIVGVAGISAERKDADLAVLRLSRPVVGIPVATVNRSLVVSIDTVGTLVGFGITSGLAVDPGIKREGAVRTAACDSADTTSLCWNYDAAVGLPGADSNTCQGDSGGPLWVREAADSPALLLAGVTSGGKSGCAAGDHAYDVDVRQFAEWIAQEAAAAPEEPGCNSSPMVGGDGTQVLGGGRQLSIGEFQDYVFRVPVATATLVVAMNGTDNSLTNFGLFVKQGEPATTAANDCSQNKAGNFAVCRFDRPAAGEWYARVDQQGQQRAEFQLVVTTYSQPVPAPADASAAAPR